MVNIGETATFSCEYSQNHINDPKIIFKEGKDSIEMIYNTSKKKERFSVSDDRQNKLMTVRITAVTPDDGGVYLCGVWIREQSYSYFIINTVHLHVIDSCCGASKTVNVNSTETAFSCEYSWDQRYDGKTIFKTGNYIIDEMISTTKLEDQKERFSVSDDRHNKLFKVRITAVTPDDGGVYLCGVWINRHSYSYSIINTVHLYITTKVGVSRATGHSGGRMMIKCEHPQHKTKPKYICKESDGCPERNNPGVQDEWMENGDVYLYDDTRAGVLMVFFRELKAADAGTYRCGVNVSHYTESFTELQLDVRDDVMFVTESAHLGEEVNITCQIPEEHTVHFCKEDDDHICQNISTSAVTEMSPSPERNEERVFTVSISNVSLRDAGVYWCGAETRDTHLTFISLTTKIQLNLFMAPVVRREGESAEIFCPYDSIYKSKSKSLCKGKCSTRDRNTLNETVREEKETKTDRLTLNDDVTASVFTGTITGLTAEDAGKYWCAVTLERDVNYLYTHLIVIMNEELNLTKYEGDDVSIQCKHHDEHQKCFCKAHEPSMCVKDGVSLETIRDDRLSFSDEASTGVFTVNITDLREEDSGIYWCGSHITTKVTLTVKKGFSMIIIICVCVSLLLIGGFTLTVCKLRHKRRGRTMTSDKKKTNAMSSCADSRRDSLSDPGSAQIYSHDELPTIPSDELLYASVSFQKHEESLSEASVTVSKNELYSDYATIIFKEGKDSIEMIYSTSKKTERFSVSDDRHKNLFNVRITAVTPDDGGVYLCGVWINRHSYSYSIINTVHLHIGMAPVVRREGESAEIFCPYDSIYKSKSKSLCKGKCSTRDRNTLNETVREEKETKTDRLTLNDDVTASVFTGTITGLTAEDAGKYWCALERDVNYLYTHLIVIMNEELDLTKYEGDDVSIQCKHHDEHQKCFCKAHEPSMCVKDGVSLETIRDDRFSFSDEASTGFFTVNITDLREEDSGIYWCGSHIITKVNLTVKQDFSLINIISLCSTLLLIGGFAVTECLLR
ncbi:unnamed protein product [Leuciscus chuanchicus]